VDSESIIGKRVRLISTSDQYTHLTTGELGYVRFVDDMGTVMVKWDSGSVLGMVEGEDFFEFVD
jgi:hypothetical protein